MDLCPEWYLSKHLNYQLKDSEKASLKSIFDTLIKNNLSQPQVYVHRDYHCRNLMVTDQNNPGVLDFQDAVFGPITYDLVSLWRDAYIEWDEEQQIDWVVRYWEKAKKSGLHVNHDFGDFYRDYEWMGLQRHLKVLGIFARLFHRDGKDGYLKDLPLVLRYTEKVAQRYIAFKPLVRILDAAHQVNRPDGLTF
jgi:aminoglycoside/choline kinase family phosphotransferase